MSETKKNSVQADATTSTMTQPWITAWQDSRTGLILGLDHLLAHPYNPRMKAVERLPRFLSEWEQ